MTRLSNTADAQLPRARYFNTDAGRLGCQVVELDGRPMVSVWRPGRGSMGLWHLDRFGGRLDAAGVRTFIAWATSPESD